ncbi:MAG: hypothetical protein WBJ06_07585 [Candidatus Methanoculleus thermohydrogenotrophicum]|nr:hypothetical protein [Candidatus Methanoculleus thermohydrogenotrophicum]
MTAESGVPNMPGLRIDTGRWSFVVMVFAVEEGEGQILATGLYIYAVPSTRCAAGDEGFLLGEPCGRGYPLLKKIPGRQMLITPEGKHIHRESGTHIFWEISRVAEFQATQEKIDHLIFNTISKEGFDEEQLDRIAKRSPGWDIEFKYVDLTRAGKHKSIINGVSHA